MPLLADPRHTGHGQHRRHGVDTHARIKGLGRTLGLVRLGVGGGVVIIPAGGDHFTAIDFLRIELGNLINSIGLSTGNSEFNNVFLIVI